MTSPLAGAIQAPPPRLPVLMLRMRFWILWMLQAPRKAPFARLQQRAGRRRPPPPEGGLSSCHPVLARLDREFAFIFVVFLARRTP